MKNKYFTVLVFLLLNLLIYGYQYGANAYQDQDLPFIHRTIDASLYPQDLFINTIKSIPTLFVPLMAFVSRWAPLSTAFFIFYLIAKFILFLTVFNLTNHFFHDKETNVLALFLLASAPLANSFGLFGDEPVMKFLLYHSTWTMPFLVLSIYLFLRQKYILSLFLLSVCVYFSGLLSNFVLILFFFGSITVLKQHHQKFEKSRLVTGWLILSGLWIPLIYVVLSRAEAQIPSVDFLDYLKNWYAGHYFPLTWSIDKWQIAITYVLLFGIFIYAAEVDARNRKIVYYFLGAIYVMWAAGFLFGVLSVWSWPIILQFLRSDVFFVLFGLIFAAGYIQKLMFSQNQSSILLACLLILMLVDLHFYSSSLSPFILLILILFHLDAVKEKWFSSMILRKAITGLFRFAVLALFVVCAFGLHSSTLPKASYLIVLFFLGLLGIAQFKPIKGFSLYKNKLYIYVILAIVSFVYFDVIVYRISQRKLSYDTPFTADWQDVQQWAQDHTSKEVQFVVPPYINGFRSFSKRSVFIEKLDGGFMQLAPGFEKIWAKRMMELGYSKIPSVHFSVSHRDEPASMKARAVYVANSEETFTALKKRYHVDFVVEERFRPLSFPLVYQNNHFSVYSIP
ncbi:MAG: DUF6798 domain-containing protein [Candidatus Omnitrophota bacterium]